MKQLSPSGPSHQREFRRFQGSYSKVWGLEQGACLSCHKEAVPAEAGKAEGGITERTVVLGGPAFQILPSQGGNQTLLQACGSDVTRFWPWDIDLNLESE